MSIFISPQFSHPPMADATREVMREAPAFVVMNSLDLKATSIVHTEK
jgi:hypothetical protein